MATNVCNGFVTSTSNTQEGVTLRHGQDVVLVDLRQRGCGRGFK